MAKNVDCTMVKPKEHKLPTATQAACLVLLVLGIISSFGFFLI